MPTKQKPIQINKLDPSLYQLIVDGNNSELDLSPELILHLAKLTKNAGWLGWSLPTTSRSTRSALLLELALVTIQGVSLEDSQKNLQEAIVVSNDDQTNDSAKETENDPPIKDSPTPIQAETIQGQLETVTVINEERKAAIRRAFT